MPYSGDFSGFSWNSQALVATHAGKQHAKMRNALRLMRSHSFGTLQETHSNKGKELGTKLPPNITAFWSHGSNYQAGVAIMVQLEFLKCFNPVRDEDWVQVEPGRTALLRLRGPAVAMDLICVYWATGVGTRGMRKESMTKLAETLSPSSSVLAVIAGDFNYVGDRLDRVCGSSGSFTGGGDRGDEETFQELIGGPFQIAEWGQEHFTHCNEIGRSRIDRMYCNQHVAAQMDRTYGCAALKADKTLSAAQTDTSPPQGQWHQR